MSRTPAQKTRDAERARNYRIRQAQIRKANKQEEEYKLRTEYRRNKDELERNEELCKSIYNLEDKD